MLKPQALAGSFAAATVALYLFLFLLRILAPPFFKLILNSQFFGTDLASQVPPFNLANLLGMLIAVGVTAWIFGYLAATFYNKFR